MSRHLNMTEPPTEIGDAPSTAGMASLMTLGHGQPLWPDSDLTDLFRHQLAAPLLPDLRRCAAINPATLAEVEAVMADAPAATFGDLLLHPGGPLPVLRVVKDFGKSAVRGYGPLPSEIAHVLYYTSIVAALVWHDQLITATDVPGLTRGAEWVTRQTWTDPATAKLCANGLAKLKVVGARVGAP